MSGNIVPRIHDGPLNGGYGNGYGAHEFGGNACSAAVEGMADEQRAEREAAGSILAAAALIDFDPNATHELFGFPD